MRALALLGLAAMTLALPAALGTSEDDAARLRDALLFEDHIEVGVKSLAGRLWVRIAAQIYNEMSDYERLGEAVARRAESRETR